MTRVSRVRRGASLTHRLRASLDGARSTRTHHGRDDGGHPARPRARARRVRDAGTVPRAPGRVDRESRHRKPRARRRSRAVHVLLHVHRV